MSIPIIPHSSVKTKPIPANINFSIESKASSKFPQDVGLLDEALYPVYGLYGTLAGLSVRLSSNRQQTLFGRVVSSGGKFAFVDMVMHSLCAG